ncbi:MAG: thiamine pyrophosphate-dependent dehydrogenase E1 component subunit alpha [Chloroflexi bacterium]|nr:thiamine pyrophosphate-dependent dehydrogenase E1 component subunit alpha [Chloroflexota bacterium]
MAESEGERAWLSKDQKLGLLRVMMLIRRCEEQLARAYLRGELPGGCHTYIGEEAVAAGVCATLRTTDAVFSTHRGHGHALAKGVSPKRVIAEVFGKATGCCGGRGGSMHLFEPEVGFYGTTGIVGPGILLATGGGYATRLASSDRVIVDFFGDGATNNGAFHEGLNLAAIWELPVVFVCENNLYATEVPYAQTTKHPSAAYRASVYGLPCVDIDGNDVEAVFYAAQEAVARARAAKGPTLIECRTYRTRPHAEGMRDTGYRTQEEVDSWKARDPIASYRSVLLAEGAATDAEMEQLDAETSRIAEEAAEFARQSPWPDPSTVTDHIFSAT